MLVTKVKDAVAQKVFFTNYFDGEKLLFVFKHNSTAYFCNLNTLLAFVNVMCVWLKVIEDKYVAVKNMFTEQLYFSSTCSNINCIFMQMIISIASLT